MKIVHSSEMAWTDALTRGRYRNRRKALATGKINCGLWELAPGKKSFPLHSHKITEEALFVVSGKAKVRTLEGESAIGPGDFVSFPPGGPAHQLVNDGSEPLVYLAMSASELGDIVEYPESGKWATVVGGFPNGKRMLFKADGQVEDYFLGEKDAEG